MYGLIVKRTRPFVCWFACRVKVLYRQITKPAQRTVASEILKQFLPLQTLTPKEKVVADDFWLNVQGQFI